MRQFAPIAIRIALSWDSRLRFPKARVNSISGKPPGYAAAVRYVTLSGSNRAYNNRQILKYAAVSFQDPLTVKRSRNPGILQQQFIYCLHPRISASSCDIAEAHDHQPKIGILSAPQQFSHCILGNTVYALFPRLMVLARSC